MCIRDRFSREGFDLSNFRQELLEKGKDSSLQTIRDEIIGMNIFNSVFVDCTALSLIHIFAIGIISSRIPFRPRQVNVLASTIAISG